MIEKIKAISCFGEEKFNTECALLIEMGYVMVSSSCVGSAPTENCGGSLIFMAIFKKPAKPSKYASMTKSQRLNALQKGE